MLAADFGWGEFEGGAAGAPLSIFPLGNASGLIQFPYFLPAGFGYAEVGFKQTGFIAAIDFYIAEFAVVF